MVSSRVRFLFTRCGESQTTQLVNKSYALTNHEVLSIQLFRERLSKESEKRTRQSRKAV